MLGLPAGRTDIVRICLIILFTAQNIRSQTGDCLFGDGCVYPCHCLDSAVCDVNDGSCTAGCDDGALGSDIDNLWRGEWEGYGCQIGNVAYGQTAENGPFTNGGNVGVLALDGNPARDITQSSCAYAEDSGVFGTAEPAWWTVTLDQDYVIQSLVITTSQGDTNDLVSDTNIEVSQDIADADAYQPCATIGSVEGRENISVACAKPVRGTYVRLMRNAGALRATELVVCEVQVIGYLYQDCTGNMWGVACTTPCHCETTCDDITGSCPSDCATGWTGVNCQTPSDEDGDGGSSGGSNTNMIIGVVVLIIIVIIAVIIVVFVVLRRKNILKKSDSAADPFSGIESGERRPRSYEETMLDVVRSRPVKTRDLSNYIYDISHQPDRFKKEYMQVGAAAEADRNSRNQANGAIEGGSEQFSYISASYLKGYPDKKQAFIISAAPSKHNEEKFWRLILETKPSCVISLLTPEEQNKIASWPLKRRTVYSGYTVDVQNTSVFIHWKSSDATVTKQGASHKTKYLNYTAWPLGVEPSSAGSLLGFRDQFRAHMGTASGPCVVFCSPTLGRSATYIALDHCVEEADNEAKIDACQYAVYMRTQREDIEHQLKQYRFLYTAAYEYVQCADAAKSKKRDVEYKILQKVKRVYSNQDVEDLSGNANPLALVDSTGPLNAVFVDGPVVGHSFISCSLPPEQHVADFWKMMVEQKSNILVMLVDNVQDGPTYWPTKSSESLQAGSVKVELANQENTKTCSVYELLASQQSGAGTALSVKLYHFSVWSEYEDVPAATDGVHHLATSVHKSYMESTETNRGPVTIVCRTGYHHSGVLCAALCLMQKKNMDAFTAVRSIRLSRPEFITNLGQYKLVCDLASKR